jgi:PAS domain S-box-containing protein
MEELSNKSVEEFMLIPGLAIEYLKQSQHGVIAVNHEAKIIIVNRSAELMFGFQKSELIGQPIEILLPDVLREKHKEHRTGFIDKPRNRPMGIGLELKAKRKDGTEINIDINLIPVPSVNGLITIAEINRR